MCGVVLPGLGKLLTYVFGHNYLLGHKHMHAMLLHLLYWFVLSCRRMKAAFAAYKERQMPLMKEEKPGLKQSQYQDMIFKAWQKSSENPLIRAQLAGTR